MIIGIAGGSGSGKTTFTNAIKEMFKEDVLIIRHDDYYKDHSNLSFEEKSISIMITQMHWKRICWWNM